MRPRISLRGFVRPSVRRSVPNAFVKYIVFILFFLAHQMYGILHCLDSIYGSRRFLQLLLLLQPPLMTATTALTAPLTQLPPLQI